MAPIPGPSCPALRTNPGCREISTGSKGLRSRPSRGDAVRDAGALDLDDDPHWPGCRHFRWLPEPEGQAVLNSLAQGSARLMSSQPLRKSGPHDAGPSFVGRRWSEPSGGSRDGAPAGAPTEPLAQGPIARGRRSRACASCSTRFRRAARICGRSSTICGATATIGRAWRGPPERRKPERAPGSAVGFRQAGRPPLSGAHRDEPQLPSGARRRRMVFRGGRISRRRPRWRRTKITCRKSELKVSLADGNFRSPHGLAGRRSVAADGKAHGKIFLQKCLVTR